MATRKKPKYKDTSHLSEIEKAAVEILEERSATEDIWGTLRDSLNAEIITRAMEQALKVPAGEVEMQLDREKDEVVFIDHSHDYEASEGKMKNLQNAEWHLKMFRHYRGMSPAEVIADKIKWDDWATIDLIKQQEAPIGNMSIDDLKKATSDSILSQYINMTDYAHRQGVVPRKKAEAQSEKERLTRGARNDTEWLAELKVGDNKTLAQQAKEYYKSIGEKLARKNTNKYFAQLKHFTQIQRTEGIMLDDNSVMWDSDTYHLPEFFKWVYDAYLNKEGRKWKDLSVEERQGYYNEFLTGETYEKDDDYRVNANLEARGLTQEAVDEVKHMRDYLLESDIKERRHRGRKSKKTPEEKKAERLARLNKWLKRSTKE